MSRPIIKLHLSKFDKTLEGIGYIMLLALWVFTFYSYYNLPDNIPIHFNASGVPNNFGSKVHIFILPVIATIIYWGITMLNKHPNILNYAVKITPENAEQQYTFATRILRFLKLSIVLIFSMIILITYLTAMGKMRGTGSWFLPFIFCLTILPTAYYIIKAFRAK